MGNEVATIPGTGVAAPFDMTEQEVALVKSLYAPKTNDLEFKEFLSTAKSLGLDPRKKQICCQVYNEGKDNRSLVIVVTIMGYRSIAADTGCYAGNERIVYGPIMKGDPNSPDPRLKIDHPEWAEYTVYRMTQGQRCPFTAVVYWMERAAAAYNKETRKWDKLKSQWENPYGQLGKCAEAAALRTGFPEKYAGTYIQEDMDHVNDDNDIIPEGNRVVESTVTVTEQQNHVASQPQQQTHVASTAKTTSAKQQPAEPKTAKQTPPDRPSNNDMAMKSITELNNRMGVDPRNFAHKLNSNEWEQYRENLVALWDHFVHLDQEVIDLLAFDFWKKQGSPDLKEEEYAAAFEKTWSTFYTPATGATPQAMTRNIAKAWINNRQAFDTLFAEHLAATPVETEEAPQEAEEVLF